MINFADFLSSFPELLSIFLLMLSSFLIGYFSSYLLQKLKYKNLIARLKNEVNEALVQKNIRDIDTLFTEIKPKIIEVVKNTQNEINNSATAINVAEKTRTNFVTYSQSKLKLDFDNFGFADITNKDDLTQIRGVGPYIEQKLNEIGIYNYDQISRFKESDIRVITELIDFFPGRIERDDWVGQAMALMQIK